VLDAEMRTFLWSNELECQSESSRERFCKGLDFQIIEA